MAALPLGRTLSPDAGSVLHPSFSEATRVQAGVSFKYFFFFSYGGGVQTTALRIKTKKREKTKTKQNPKQV